MLAGIYNIYIDSFRDMEKIGTVILLCGPQLTFFSHLQTELVGSILSLAKSFHSLPSMLVYIGDDLFLHQKCPLLENKLLLDILESYNSKRWKNKYQSSI